MASVPPVRPRLHQGSRRPHPRGVGRVTPIPTPTGPLSRFLQDPWEVLHALLDRSAEALPVVLLSLIVGVAAFAAWRLWIAVRARRLSRSARMIRFLPPPADD